MNQFRVLVKHKDLSTSSVEVKMNHELKPSSEKCLQSTATNDDAKDAIRLALTCPCT